MVQDAEVRVKLKAEGAEETKARLLETRAALVGVSSEQLKNAQSQRQAARDANVLNNAEAYRTRIYLAQHPVLNQVSRSMQTFGSISRGVLAITTAFSTAFTAFGRESSRNAQLQAQIAQKQRELAFELSKAMPDPMIVANLKGELNALNAEMDESKRADQQGFITNLINMGAAFSLMGGSASKAYTSLLTRVPALGAMTTALGSISFLAATAGAVLAGFFAGTWLRENVLPDAFKKPIDDFFFKSIPEAVQAGIDAFLGFGSRLPDIWTTIQAGFISFWNGMVNTVTNAVNSIINSVKSAIDTIAQMPSNFINGVSGGLGALIQQQRHGPQNARANGGMITEPVLGVGLNSGQTWSFGEVGPEMVVPMGGGSGFGGGTKIVNVYVTVEGSLLAQRDLEKGVDKALKDNLKRHGW